LLRLIASGEEPLKLLGGLAWRVRTLLQAKGLAAGGARPHEISQAVRIWRDDFQRALGRFSDAELLTFPAQLLAADRALKSRGLDARAVLDTLVRGLTGPAAEAQKRA
jgi:DNA polymerase-3 subunit delta